MNAKHQLIEKLINALNSVNLECYTILEAELKEALDLCYIAQKEVRE